MFIPFFPQSISYRRHKSQWRPFAPQSCLRFYSRCASFGHSLTMWLTVSSLCSHVPHCESSCVSSMLASIVFVCNDWVCAAIVRPSVSCFNSPSQSHPQDSGSYISLVCLKNWAWRVFSSLLFWYNILILHKKINLPCQYSCQRFPAHSDTCN